MTQLVCLAAIAAACFISYLTVSAVIVLRTEDATAIRHLNDGVREFLHAGRRVRPDAPPVASPPRPRPARTVGGSRQR